MARKVVVELTVAEARALSHAAGNSTDSPDAMEALFQAHVERNAAYRGHLKLDQAIRRVGGWARHP